METIKPQNQRLVNLKHTKAYHNQREKENNGKAARGRREHIPSRGTEMKIMARFSSEQCKLEQQHL